MLIDGGIDGATAVSSRYASWGRKDNRAYLVVSCSRPRCRSRHSMHALRHSIVFFQVLTNPLQLGRRARSWSMTRKRLNGVLSGGREIYRTS